MKSLCICSCGILFFLIAALLSCVLSNDVVLQVFSQSTPNETVGFPCKVSL